MRIIDAHVHVEQLPQYGLDDGPETILPLMDEAGIDTAVMMSYSDAPFPNEGAIEYLANVMHRYPGRFLAFARIHPAAGDAAVRLLERAINEYGFHGLKLHGASNLMHPALPEVVHLLECAVRLNVPTLFHCGEELYCTPYELELSARAVPEAKIILAHLGGYTHAAEAIQVAQRNPNVYVDTSACPYPRWIRAAVDALGPHKVLFGSDGPGCDPRLERYKIERAGLSADELCWVLGGNIERLLERQKCPN